MGRQRTFTIKENLKDLESFKLKVRDYKSSQELNALILIKSDQYDTLEKVSSDLGVHYATLQRWLKRYKEEGIERLLLPLTRNKSSKFITPEIHKALESRLHDRDNPFSGYVEVQQWLLDTYKVKIGYKWLWAYLYEDKDELKTESSKEDQYQERPKCRSHLF